MNSTALSPNDVLVRAQETPNPNALKFVANFTLKETGKATFKNVDSANGHPLVASIFEIPGVEQVYLSQNTMTVTHSGELPTNILSEQVKAVMQTRAAVHDPRFTLEGEGGLRSSASSAESRPPRGEQIDAIEAILDRTIRPGLQSDGGDVEVISFEYNELRILYQGACGGCPSSMMGTLDAIQSILRHEMGNEEIIVVPI